MSDDVEGTSEPEKPFYIERAKTGRSNCKKCKEKINSGDLRIGKLAYNPFASGTMKLWHHVPCMFEVFKKQRKTTKRIETNADIGGWEQASEDDKKTLKSFLTDEELLHFDTAPTPAIPTKDTEDNKDNSFRVFRKICSELTNASSYLQKTSILKDFFTKGSDEKSFKGDIQLWCKCLLPMADKVIYNLQSKQLVKIFSDILREDQDSMLEHLEKGDVADTIGHFFVQSKSVTPSKKSLISLPEVDSFLQHLSKLTKEVDQVDHFSKLLPKCTANDLIMVIRLIKHDLRINAGPKHILEALHPDAYPAFQASRNLSAVVADACKGNIPQEKKGIDRKIVVMTPTLPMLAEPCKSADMAFSKCRNGMFSEIKYDGERVQLHKQGSEFKYFSRSLKPVVAHKVNHFVKYIPQAFPHGKDLILDCEILMVDHNTGRPLPFGTLGIHKKSEFRDATVCLFVFDCIYFNGVQLIDKPISYRRKILHENMTEIKNRVMFSEMKEIYNKEDLEDMMENVFRQGLEGLVLKPRESLYEPGKRHWLKVKKDYLCDGAMADSADLVVLGAWYGTGKKGGIMSTFLMGCYDTKRKRWVTVTKVHGGHDDRTLDALQTQLRMNKIAKDVKKVPSWLVCGKTMVPDFIISDPRESQVWEITGAEFTRNQVHTADGISIRFPRVTKIRDDKNWESATSLSELMKLYEKSKDTSDFTLKRSTESSESSPTKVKSNDAKKKDAGSGSETEVDEEFSSDLKPVGKNSSNEKKERDKTKKKDKSSDNSSRKRKDNDRQKSRIESGSGSETEVDEEFSGDLKPKTSTNERKERDKTNKKENRGNSGDGKGKTDDRKRNRADSGSETDVDEEFSGDLRSAETKSKTLSPDEKKLDKTKKNNENSSRSSDDPSRKGKDKTNDKKKGRSEERENSSDRKTKEKTLSKIKRRKDDSLVDKSNRRTKRPSSDAEMDVSHKKMRIEANRKETNLSPRKENKMQDSGSDTEVDEDYVCQNDGPLAMSNPLPEVFSNCGLLLHSDVSNDATVQRYVIAYGGTIFVKETQNSFMNNNVTITHVVYPRKEMKNMLTEMVSKDAYHVSVGWVWDSIKSVSRQKEKPYRVISE